MLTLKINDNGWPFSLVNESGSADFLADRLGACGAYCQDMGIDEVLYEASLGFVRTMQVKHMEG